MRLPCVHAIATTPAQRLGILFARFPSHISLPRKGRRVGLRDVLFEAYSAFTHVTACTLAGSPIATPYIGGSSHFVTSMTAPIASGRSDLAGWVSHPLVKRRLITAHTQGGQVALLWTELLKLNIKLHFAHRTFRWSNEGKGIAAVHCVIMGFHLASGSNNVGEALASTVEAKASPTNKFAPTVCRLFDYGDDIAGEPVEIQAKQINPYLVDAPTVLIEKRSKPLSLNAPEMIYGSKPTDGGNLLLTEEEANTILQNDPIAAKYIRPFLGAEEFINNLPRYCLWLKNSTAQERKNSPEIQRRIEAVVRMRSASTDKETLKDAATPYLFQKIRQTDQPAVFVDTQRFFGATEICSHWLFSTFCHRQQSGVYAPQRQPLSLRGALLDHAQRLDAGRLRQIGKPLSLLQHYRLQQFSLAANPP